jgi:hypothetical protein
MKNDSFLAFLFLCLLQKQNTYPRDDEGHDARINGEGDADCEQLPTKNGSDHSASEMEYMMLETRCTSRKWGVMGGNTHS